MLNFVPFAPAHFDELIAWFPTEPETIGWGGALIRFPLDKAQCVTMVEEGRCEPPVRLSWMVERDGVWVGFIGLVFDWRHGNATVSRVAVAPAARGQGIAGPMVAHVIDIAFAQTGIERVELNVYPWNVPARRTYERLGFVEEGVRRSSTRVGDERWDVIIMGILKSEFLARS